MHRARGWPARTGGRIGDCAVLRGLRRKRVSGSPAAAGAARRILCLFFAAAVQDTVSIRGPSVISRTRCWGLVLPISPRRCFRGLSNSSTQHGQSVHSVLDICDEANSTMSGRSSRQVNRSTATTRGQPRTLESENTTARLAGVCLGFRVSSNNARGRGSVECFCHQCNHRSDYFARVFGASPHRCTTSPACRDKIPTTCPFFQFSTLRSRCKWNPKPSRTECTAPARGRKLSLKPSPPSFALRSNQDLALCAG